MIFALTLLLWTSLILNCCHRQQAWILVESKSEGRFLWWKFWPLGFGFNKCLVLSRSEKRYWVRVVGVINTRGQNSFRFRRKCLIRMYSRTCDGIYDHQGSVFYCCRIIEDRRGQENFQLIVITHDERFGQMIGQKQNAEKYYRISKDERWVWMHGTIVLAHVDYVLYESIAASTNSSFELNMLIEKCKLDKKRPRNQH